MEEKKKKSRRNQTKYPALDPSLNLKSRSHLADYDYLHKLDEKDLKWLNDFSEGHNNANPNAEGAKEIFKTDKDKKKCYSINNARNRCILTRAHAQGAAVQMQALKIEDRLISEEDKIISRLDGGVSEDLVDNTKDSPNDGDEST